MPERMNVGARPHDEVGARHQWKFLKRIWRRHRQGYVFIAARRAGSGRWIEGGFDWTVERRDIRLFLLAHPARDWDLYFCPNAFSAPWRRAEFALRTPYAWCDIDEADPDNFVPPATILVQTSPGRHQGIWELTMRVSPEIAEGLSKGLAYDFGADRNGWSVTKYLRIPFSRNHKPTYNRPMVRLEHDDSKQIRPWRAKKVVRTAPVEVDVNPASDDWKEVFERYRRKLPSATILLVKARRVLNPDRSQAIYAIVSGLHRAGASPDEIATVLWANPHFVEKHGKNVDRLNEEIGRILSKQGGVQ